MKWLFLGALVILGVGGYLAVKITDDPRPTTVSTRESLQEQEPHISVLPENPIQGDPLLISVDGVGTSTVESLALDGKKLKIFIYKDKPSALAAIDLRARTGTYVIETKLDTGEKVKRDLNIGTKAIAKAPLGIPEKLGGDTPEAEKTLINTLVEEGKLISAVSTAGEKLWSGAFRLPIEPPIVVTDVYGYSRVTGSSNISHKGTDYRAKVGTPVYAMNDGIVRFRKFLRNYGNTIILDHGLGLHTVYMHLSETLVSENQRIKKGELIGKSGESGYVVGPHLHLSVRINGVSIDPEKFMNILGD